LKNDKRKFLGLKEDPGRKKSQRRGTVTRGDQGTKEKGIRTTWIVKREERAEARRKGQTAVKREEYVKTLI